VFGGDLADFSVFFGNCVVFGVGIICILWFFWFCVIVCGSG